MPFFIFRALDRSKACEVVSRRDRDKLDATTMLFAVFFPSFLLHSVYSTEIFHDIYSQIVDD